MKIERSVPSVVGFIQVVLLILAFLPGMAMAQEAEEKTSPFEALRWNGDAPEVMVRGTWYRPLAIHGVKVEEVLAFIART